MLSKSEIFYEGNGAIHLKWIPKPAIHFKFYCDINLSKVKCNEMIIGPAKLKATNRPLIDFDVFVTNFNAERKNDHLDAWICGEMSTPKTLIVDDIDCNEVKFHMVNFIRYPGNLIADFNSCEWKITIDEIDNASEIYKDLTNDAGYAITHTGLLRHKRGTITFGEAVSLLNALYYFSAFLSGRWCGPVLSIGLFNGNKVWESWDIVTTESFAILDKLDKNGRKIREPVSGPRDCLRITYGISGWDWTALVTEKELYQLFQGFMRKWADESWINPLKTALFLYVEANQASGGVEGAIVLTQSALELLTSLHKDEHLKNKPCKNKFDDIAADIRIRWLLEDLGIPIQIPSSLNELKIFSDNKFQNDKYNDGPRAVTYFRNSIIHPDRKKLARLEAAENLIKLQILWLGIWYLEMALLRIFDYSGNYSNRLWRFQDRTFKGGLGFLQQVPWGNAPKRSQCEHCPIINDFE